MGTYKIGIDELADEIYDLMYDLEGDWTFPDFITAAKRANARLNNWNRDFNKKGVKNARVS